MTLSDAELTERLKRAAAAVEQADLADDLRQIAFERALGVLGVGGAPAAEASATEPRPNAGQDSAIPSSGGGLLGAVSKRLGLELDRVSRVYEEEDGQIRLIVRRAMLPNPNSRAASMRDVALLVVVGRQAARLEDQTPYALVREECRELKVLDDANFSTEIGKLEFRTEGGRNTRTARANRHHYDDAAELIRQMTEGDQP